MAHLALLIIVIAALAAIVGIALNAMGLKLPGWAVQILVVVLVSVVAILAIRFVLSV